MIDIKVNGQIWARAENEEDENVYRLFFAGIEVDEIAARLDVSPERVRGLTRFGER